MNIPRIRLAPILALAFAGSVSAASGQQIVITNPGEGMVQIPGMPPRQLKSGTGRISGRVLSAETGAPLRRAQVRILGPDVGAKAAMTDAEGRYEFRELPAGRFNLTASKSGYVMVQYGQTRPFEAGRPIELADNQVVEKADISMPRGSVISGRIVDEFGEPVADAMVSAMRQSWMGGRRRFVPAGRTAQTNDLGQFRMYGLPPGEYYVSASLRNSDTMMFEMLGQQGGPTGSNPGSGYAPTYFPGTTSPSDAQKISLAVGQEAQGTEFALIAVKLARISGLVMNAEGKPVSGAMVRASPVGRGGDIAARIMGGTGARTSTDGTFTLNHVAPGEYSLDVRSVQITRSDGGEIETIRGMGGDAEFASLPVTVAGDDLTNVTVVTSKGATATGRITFEGGSKPANLAGIRVTAMPAEMSEGPMMGGAGASVKADGTFELKGLVGRRLLRVGNLPDGWMLKALRLDGNDITDTGADFKPGHDVPALEIVATPRTTEITGGVTSSNGTVVKDYTVIVFSDNPEHWALPMSRWVAGARPDQEGRFKFRNMPPGSYYAVAVDYVEQGAWGDPDLLDRLKGAAKRFTLGEGGTETLELDITQG